MQRLIKYILCPECGKKVEINTNHLKISFSKVSASYPAQYKYYCECGKAGYCNGDEMFIRYIEQ